MINNKKYKKGKLKFILVLAYPFSLALFSFIYYTSLLRPFLFIVISQ